ncbi:MAG TPA: cell division topological specificity factor MinE [Trichocoleus sp.]|jgi:cell division topological specificity factor
MLNQILDRIFSRGSTNSESSRVTARRRLQLVLAHDRADLSPAMVEKMREEILQVVSRYVEIDRLESEFVLESDQRTTALIANLPIKRVRAEAIGEAKLVDHMALDPEGKAEAQAEDAAELSQRTSEELPPLEL